MRRIFDATIPTTSPAGRPAVLRHGLAVGAVVVSWLVREALAPAEGAPPHPFIAFVPAVTLACWYGGRRPGILAAALAAFAANWHAGAHGPVFRVDDPISFGILLAATAAIVAVVDALQSARRQASKARDVLATTLASIGDGVVMTDEHGAVVFLNPEAERLTGWTRADARGRPLSEVFAIVNETTRAEVESPALRAMREGLVVGLANHTILLARSGEERPIDDSAAPIRDPRGEVVGSVLVFRDVTARRREEREREELRRDLAARVEELREADQRKNQFLATLAHELRNPLAPIRNSVGVLQLDGSRSPEAAHAAEVIGRQVDHLSRLLDDLLDVNRLGRGKLTLRKERVTLSSVLESALETARPALDAGRHRVRFDASLDVELDADRIRLAQVFANLLNNAAKYTDPGGSVDVTVSREADEVLVSVKDNGIGIPPDALPRLFEMFSQLPQTRQMARGGVGIGLALAKGLVELHGGRIEARSDGPGRGSEFLVRLPVAAPAGLSRDPAPAPPPRADGVRRRILIADDVRDNADTLALMLRALGHEVFVAYDGAHALATAEREQPEVALLDIGMPAMNGYDVCRRIRAAAWGRDMVVIAQTGWGQEEDRRRAQEAGFDRHLLKPVDPTVVLSALTNPAESRSRG